MHYWSCRIFGTLPYKCMYSSRCHLHSIPKAHLLHVRDSSGDITRIIEYFKVGEQLTFICSPPATL